jgi:hypothetical protein
MKHFSSIRLRLVFCIFLAHVAKLHAQNKILGEIQLEGAIKVEKTSGVWVDGQYVGYLKEVKGSKKILLLPGTHEIAVRQGGYLDFTRKGTVQPGEKQLIHVAMEKDFRAQAPRVTAEVKLSVNPTRAAVFVDGVFVGHVAEFSGVGKGCWSHPENARSRLPCLDTMLSRPKPTLLPTRNSRLRPTLSRTVRHSLRRKLWFRVGAVYGQV